MTVYGSAGAKRVGFMVRLFALVFCTLLIAGPASAAQCGGDFQTFLSAMGREAQAAGVSRGVIDQAFAGVTVDPAVLSFDRRQRGTFRKSFEEYASTRVLPPPLHRATAVEQTHSRRLAPVAARL